MIILGISFTNSNLKFNLTKFLKKSLCFIILLNHTLNFTAMTIIKKILIAVFLPLATFSQTRFKVIECHSDIKLDSEWIRFQQFYPTQMTAIADGNIFSIDNEYHSIFKIYGDTTMLIKPDFTLYGWDALDKLDSPCAVIFVKFNNDRCLYSFTAFYDKISYYYSLSLIE